MFAAITALFLTVSCGDDPLENDSFKLSRDLLEISGLAQAGPTSVFAHDDEYAIVHELDVHTGKTLRSFALGKPSIEGDFEGIAAAGDKLYLVTSDGLIYGFMAGENRKRVHYTAHDSGIGPQCEIEGLEAAPDGEALLLLCKRLRDEEAVPRLEIYRWALDSEHADPEPWLALPFDSFLEPRDRATFAPSGLAWDEERQRLWVVSARNHMLAEFDVNGRPVAVRRLDRSRHRQTEGIEILPGCLLVLADEGNDRNRARLSTYPCPADPVQEAAEPNDSV